jgi:hypothetical protein
VILELSLGAASACEEAEQREDDDDDQDDEQDAEGAPPLDDTTFLPSTSVANLRSFVRAN